MALAISASAQTDPPSSGDWVVEDNTLWDKDLVLTGNLTVNSSGLLRLDNMTLTMSGPVDGGLTIWVESGSALELINVNVLSSSGDVHYWFICEGRVRIDRSDVRDAASNAARWSSWDSIRGGVQIYDGSSVLVNSKFHDNQRINVYVSGCSPTIDRCEFYNSEYVESYTAYSYHYEISTYANQYYTDATGLYLESADPNITRCTFRDNGLRSSALPYYSTSYSRNLVLTYGRGILAHDSSPNITSCEFRTNGDQPNDRSVEGVQQQFREYDYLFYIGPAQGGLVCVGTAHPVVVGSQFLTNDLFGIYGIEGGYPNLVESSRIEGNRYIRGSSVYSPSAGIQVDAGSGTMTVANTTAGGNYVLANIYTDSVSVRLINFTNTNNVVNNAYNIYVGGSSNYFEDCHLSGSPGLQVNVYISYNRNGQAIKARFESCELNGGDYGIYVGNWNGATITLANSSIANTGQYTFYLQSTTVDCINSTLAPLRIQSYSWGRGSTVRIMFYLEIRVQWQNDQAIPGAFVQVYNSSGDFVFGGIADKNGTIGPFLLASRTIMVSSGSEIDISNSPLKMNAYSAGLRSKDVETLFSRNLIGKNAVLIEIKDDKAPTIYVFTPQDGHSQNGTALEVRGMSTDVGAGIKATYVSIDSKDGPWGEPIAGAEQTWSKVLVMTEGVHVIWIKSIDQADNAAIKNITGVNIDLTPPALEVTDPVKATWYTSRSNYTIRGRVNGQVTLYVNRQLVEVATDGTWESRQEIHSGTNEFMITANDHVGNTWVVHKTIISDNTIPKLILTSPEEGMWTNSSQIEVKGITELGATIRVNGDPQPTFDGRFATNIYLTEGLNRIIVEAVDRANNVERVERIVRLDSIPPLLRLESPRSDMLVSERYLPVSGTIDDPSVSDVIINGLLVPVVDQRFYKEFRLDEGDNPIFIEVWDHASNYVSRSYNVVLDTTPPALVLLEPEMDLATRDPTVRIRGTVDANVNLLLWGEPQHDDFDLINLVRLSNTFRYDQYPLVRGVNTIHLYAEDEVGNVARMTLHVTYDLEPPTIILSPVAPRTSNEVITISGLLMGGSDLRINNVPGVLGPNGEFTESVHLEGGKNEIKVVALDSAGNRAESIVNVTRKAVEEPAEGILGAPVAFSLVLVIVMLAIGMAIVYPGVSGGSIEPEGMVGEPIIVDEHGEVVSGKEPDPARAPPQRPPRRRRPPEQKDGRRPPPPEHRRPPPERRGPPPEGHEHRRPPPPPPPEAPEQPPKKEGVPPKPPWR